MKTKTNPTTEIVTTRKRRIKTNLRLSRKVKQQQRQQYKEE